METPRPEIAALERLMSERAWLRLRVDDLKPGVPLRARLLDRREQACGEVEIGALQAGELRIVELSPDERFADLRGCVTDTAGRPLADATVAFRFADGRQSELTTDPSGRFSFPCARDGVEEFHAMRTGYATRAVAVTFDGAELAIALERGRDLRVLVVDEAQAPLAKTSCTYRYGAPPIELVAATDADGWLELAGLPQGAFELTLEARERSTTLRVPSDASELRAALRAR